MICVDSSVWVAALRGSEPALHRHLDHLLSVGEVLVPVIVRLELLTGVRSSQLTQLNANLLALPQALPQPRTWDRIETWIGSAISHGRRFGVADLVIAALASERDAAVWSLDRAFADMAKLGWIKMYALP